MTDAPMNTHWLLGGNWKINLVCAAMTLGVYGYQHLPDQTPQAPKPPIVAPAGNTTGTWITANTPACDGDLNSKLFGFAFQHDGEAFQRFLTDGILAGECTLFEKDEPVYLDSVGLGSSRLRRPGELKGYWTPIENFEHTFKKP